MKEPPGKPLRLRRGAGLLVSLLLSVALPSFADSIALKSGETVQGEIVSETESQVVIKVSNYNRTITSEKVIPKSEIKSIQRETAEAKKEREAYEAVQKYRLNPDQEFTVAQYDAGTAACQKFLATYPASEYAATVGQLGVQLQQEKEQVEKGLVKFGNRWMSASQKATLVGLRTHVVMKGETLHSIAMGYGVTVEDLRKANNLTSDTLKVGQQLAPPAKIIKIIEEQARKAEEQARKAEQPPQQVQSFTGIFEAFDAHTITIRNRGMNVAKTFTITSESRIVNHPVTELPSYNEEGIKRIDFPDHITIGSIVEAVYRDEGQTLTLINFAGRGVAVGADGSDDGEGAERKTNFKVEYIIKGGLFSKGCLVVSMGGRVVALENHPKQDSLAEGDTFFCHVRREGISEGTDSKGQFRRLPRWVYVPE